MVEYSNNLATGSELESSYTEPGYVEAFGNPQESANQMVESGVTAESVEKLKSTNDKVVVTSPMLKKQKFLKRLFLQYIKKYIMNPKKYIDHPKQIRNLPSWFDDAIVLFSDDELSRDQKRMIREFFYGLVQYRDNKVAGGNIGPDTEETNRQLGERSPYADYSEGDPESMVLPRQNEMQKLDVMGIAKTIAAQSIKEQRQPTMEEYVMSDGTDMAANDASSYIPTPSMQNSANMGGVQMGRVSSGFSLENYIRPFGSKSTTPAVQPIPQPAVQPTPSQGQLPVAAPQQSFRPTAIPVSGRMNIDLTSFIMGGRNKPTLFPLKSPQQIEVGSPVNQPIPVPVQQPQYRKQNKKIVPKLNRWAPKLGGIIPKGITLNKISIKGKSTKIKPNKLNNLKKMDFGNISKGITLESVMGGKSKSLKSKKKVGLGNMSDMNKVFAKIKVHSKDNYNPGKMKMQIVTDIKDQCGNAFKTNKFKTESINIKKNFMKEMKESMPVMKMEMNAMGDIHEKNTLDESMRGIPRMLQVESSSPFMVKRGSMRPKSVGITEYDFDLGNIYKKKRRSPMMEEEIYYEE